MGDHPTYRGKGFCHELERYRLWYAYWLVYATNGTSQPILADMGFSVETIDIC